MRLGTKLTLIAVTLTLLAVVAVNAKNSMENLIAANTTDVAATIANLK